MPITSILKRGAAPGNVVLLRAHSKLPVESVALACAAMTIDKVFLTEHVSSLPAATLERIDAGLELTLELR